MSLSRVRERLRIVHLFPDLLNLYGDRGNIATLAQRARWRGLDVEIRPIDATAAGAPIAADIIFIGGGPDHMQVGAAHALAHMEGSLARAISDGAALLAVCGGYQNLGDVYRSLLAGNLPGPGLFDAWTEAPEGARRIVGGVVVELEPGFPSPPWAGRRQPLPGSPGRKRRSSDSKTIAGAHSSATAFALSGWSDGATATTGSTGAKG